jgi:gas vesicle protein
MSTNHEGNLFKGILLGGAVGFALGVLFAPKSGKDLRSELMGESDDLLSKAKGELDKIKTELTDLRVKISETVDKSKGIFEKAAEESTEERDFEAEVNSMEEEKAEKEEKEEKPARKTRRKTTKS